MFPPAGEKLPAGRGGDFLFRKRNVSPAGGTGIAPPPGALAFPFPGNGIIPPDGGWGLRPVGALAFPFRGNGDAPPPGAWDSFLVRKRGFAPPISFSPCRRKRNAHLRAKSRPSGGCAPKRRCGCASLFAVAAQCARGVIGCRFLSVGYKAAYRKIDPMQMLFDCKKADGE